MAFKVLLHPKAAKDPRKLDETNKNTIKKALSELAMDPWKAGKPLHPSDFWSQRTGNYQTIYEINQDQNQVTILFIGHRKNIYTDFSKML